MKPNPGSDAAIKQGCTCPVLDNAHGRRNDGRFWIVEDCPLHGRQSPILSRSAEYEHDTRCSACGHELEAVRPGKWQCNWCEGGRFERLAQAERMMQV